MRIFTRGIWAIFLILLLIVIVFGSIFFTTINNEKDDNILETLKEFFTKEDNGKNSNDDFSNTETGGASGSDTSRSSGGGGSSGSQFCQMEQIQYSLLNINKNSVCNVEQNGICEDKTINCSIEIHNDDNEASGLFKIELYFIESGKNKSESLDLKTGEFNVAPSQFVVFQNSTNIQSTGENGTANQQINCIFQTAEIPKKEVCY